MDLYMLNVERPQTLDGCWGTGAETSLWCALCLCVRSQQVGTMPALNDLANKSVTSRRAEDLFERLQARRTLTRQTPSKAKRMRGGKLQKTHLSAPPTAWPRPPDLEATVVELD